MNEPEERTVVRGIVLPKIPIWLIIKFALQGNMLVNAMRSDGNPGTIQGYILVIAIIEGIYRAGVWARAKWDARSSLPKPE